MSLCGHELGLGDELEHSRVTVCAAAAAQDERRVATASQLTHHEPPSLLHASKHVRKPVPPGIHPCAETRQESATSSIKVR